MRSLIFSSLVSGFWILASQSAHALIDTDTDGFSDLWEGRYAFHIGANPPANQSPTADPDGDGWTNAQEALAGTDPFSSAAPNGILAPAVAYTKAIVEPPPPGADIGQPTAPPPTGDPNDPFGGATTGGGTFSEPLEIRRAARFNLTWPVVKGKAYQIHVSSDLANWQPASGFFMGGNEPLTYEGQAINTDNTEPPKLFYRIKIEDADSDGDTLTDYEETILGLDSYSKDTDKDGYADNFEYYTPGYDPLVNGLQAPWDADSLNPVSVPLFASFNFNPSGTTIAPSLAERINDISGNSRHGIVRGLFGEAQHPPLSPVANAEGIANNGFNGGGTHHYAFAVKSPAVSFSAAKTLSFWMRTKASDLAGAGQPIFCYVPHDAVFNQTVNSQNPFAIRAYLRKNPVAAGYEVVWFDWRNPGAVVRDRWTLDITEGQIDRKWANLTFVWKGQGAGTDANKNWVLYLDGRYQTRTLSTPTPTSFLNAAAAPAKQDNFLIGAVQAGGTAGDNQGSVTATLKGALDRVRFYTAALDAPQVMSIVAQDADKDGLWDATEMSATRWKDTNGNGRRDTGEISFPNGNPLQWQASDTDTDLDGLNDLSEQTRGTRIDITDTDGDRLPDGWEVKHGLNPLDPTGNNGMLGDPDGDGLVNIDEYRFLSKPTQLPGDPPIPLPGSSWDSDGDGKYDNPEVIDGGHPGDARDKGQTLPEAEKTVIKLSIGDQSTSTSEDYSVTVFEIDPETGKETEYYHHHSGGFGEFNARATPLIFLKGATYTFRIDWNGTNNIDPVTGDKLPDLDYSFKVEPQGEEVGFLIDGYSPRERYADLSKPLQGDHLNDVAQDEEEFREKISSRRVVFMGVAMKSADRMFGASMGFLPGLEGIQLEITNPDTGEDFGIHSELFTKAYASYNDILGAGDKFGKDVSDPRVWFIKDEESVVRRIQTYLCGDPAKVHGYVKMLATFHGVGIGSVRHTLSPNAEFASFLAAGYKMASGKDLGFPQATGGGADATPAPGAAHHWTAALSIPIFIIQFNNENLTILATGIYTGFVTGLADDAEFARLVFTGISDANNWVRLRALGYIYAWTSDPALRLRQMKEAIYGFVQNQICPAGAAISLKFSSTDEWLYTFWQAQARAKLAMEGMAMIAAHGLWNVCVDGLADWWEDFSQRMLDSTEALALDDGPFPKSALVSGAIAFQRTFAYTVGYSTGYLTEQVAVGYLTAGGIQIGKILLFGGEHIAAKLATRTGAVVAAKYGWLRDVLAEHPAFADAVHREFYRRGIVLYATDPTTPVIKDTAAAVIETLLKKSGFDRAVFNETTLRKATREGNLRKLTTTLGKSNVLRQRTAQLAHLLGTEADAVTMKNFLQVAEERLVLPRADGTVDEFFEGFFRAFEGNSSLMGDLADPTKSISSLSPGAKARLKAFLSDPDPGYLWKIDDPVFVDGVPQVPQNYFTRGILAELDVYVRQYKAAGFTHHPTAAGFDFTGSKWVQIKSTKNPSSSDHIRAMELAIDNLILQSPAEVPLRLHILKKPGTDSSALELALSNYKDLQPLTRNRVEILIETYNIGVP